MKTKAIMTGLGVAMAAGSAACIAKGMSGSMTKTVKKKAQKAIKAVEGMIDDLM